MCSVCNPETFETVTNETTHEIVKIKHLGMGNLILKCDITGNNYKLAVLGDEKSGYTTYHCPTCGRRFN
jgi:transposase-like protein